MQACSPLFGLLFAHVGPILPHEKTLPLAAGIGYVSGDFLITALRGVEPDPSARAEAWRQRGGVIVAIALIIVWVGGFVIGHHDNHWLSSKRSLTDLVAWFGLGPLLAGGFAWIRYGPVGDYERENARGRQTGKSVGLVLAGIYIGIWLGVKTPPADAATVLHVLGRVA